jgi:hypothetical protein
MEISSNNQLVPYNQGPQLVTPFSPEAPRSVPAVGYSAAERYILMPLPHSPRYAAHSDGQKTTYTSSRRIIAPEINQVGSIIDIYT